LVFCIEINKKKSSHNGHGDGDLGRASGDTRDVKYINLIGGAGSCNLRAAGSGFLSLDSRSS